MSEKGRSPARNIVQAEKIIEALVHEDGDAVYVLHDAQISGKLDLKHRIVHTAVDIQRCTFLDPVDLKYCEFRQAVDLSECTFKQSFVSEEQSATHTIFRKDLVCNEATFHGTAWLVGTQVEGSAYFIGARFLSKEKVSFAWASIGRTLELAKATFKGPVSFNTIKCEGGGFFRNARFENVTDEVNFGTGSFGVDLDCSNATFKGPAMFNSVKCGRRGIFQDARFENKTGKVDFTAGSFGMDLDCSNATFKGSAIFNGIRCDRSGIFRGTRFENKTGEVDFTVASFNGDLDCSAATFAGKADFNGVECRSGLFRDSRFMKETTYVSFTGASFRQDLNCSRATFTGPVHFDLMTCGGDGLFNNARFNTNENADNVDDFDEVNYGDVAFNLSSFASTLDMRSTTFNRVVSLEQVSVQKALRLTGAQFGKSASLNHATIGRLIFEGGSPSFAEEAYLDLRECTFERFQGDKVQARDLLNAQDPSRFSRDPYQQLEKYYANIGDEAEAKDIYLEGRLALRKNAYRQNTSTKWTLRQKINDEILRLLTGYGVRIGRLFVIALIVLALGTFIFYLPDNALQLSSNSTEAPSWQEGVFYRTAYSLDLFLPLVNLHIDENWEPNGPWLQAYAIGHAMVGWLIVPLLLAALAGIIRR